MQDGWKIMEQSTFSDRAYRLKFLIWGARMFGRVTGRVPERTTWPLVWGGSRRYAPDRWKQRDRDFERRDFSYEDAVQFLQASLRKGPGVIRGSAKDVVQGSMPKEELDFVAKYLTGLRKEGRPLRGLHIGDFVGLSLAHLTDAARNVHAGSVVMSIDPNAPHRGMDNPKDLVTGLMARYDLLDNWLPLTGFTLERTGIADISNRNAGTTKFASYYGFGAAHVLANLAKVGTRFDFALIDGNHNSGYLRREIDRLSRLIRPGGLLFLDDLDEHWSGVTEVFDGLDHRRFQRLARGGRAGVVRVLREKGPGQTA